MVAPERSNEELCILAQQGDEGACLQMLKQNRAYIVLQMTKIGFRYHPYWQEMIEWGEVGILSSIQDYDPSLGNTFLTFATPQILTELRDFLHSIRMAYMENYYPDGEDEESEWGGDDLYFLACQELRPLEKMYLNERQDLLLYTSMDGLPELERRYVDYRYGFATGKPMPRSEIAKRESRYGAKFCGVDGNHCQPLNSSLSSASARRAKISSAVEIPRWRYACWSSGSIAARREPVWRSFIS